MTTYEFKTEPMEHQRKALHRIIQSGGVHGLIWEMGLGKTKVVIDYVGMRAEALGRCTVFVAAPLSAVDTWGDELEAHLPDHIERRVVVLDGSGTDKVQAMRALQPPERGVLMVVTNLDVFSSSHRLKGTKHVTIRSAMTDAVRKFGFVVGVVDESHRIKGHSSNVSRALGSLAGAFKCRFILTGTVAPHSPLDIWAQWRFLNPDRFSRRFSDFKDEFAILGGYRGKQVVGFRNQQRLADLREQDSIVLLKKDAMDLPPVTDVLHHVTLSRREQKAYDEMEAKALVSTDEGPVMSPSALSQWLRLRQLSSGYIKDSITETIKDFGDTKVRHCTDLLRDLTESGEKVVVFAHFRHDVQRAYVSALKALACPVEYINGDTPQEERRRIRKDFFNHDGPTVVIAQMRTVSLAVNEFVAASHAIYLSMSERRDDYDQSRGRLDRKGQTRPVTFHHLVVRNSIDEVLYQGHATKQRLEDVLLKHVSDRREMQPA